MRLQICSKFVSAFGVLLLVTSQTLFALDDPNEKTFELTERVEDAQRKTRLMKITNLMDEERPRDSQKMKETENELLDLVERLNRLELPGRGNTQKDPPEIAEPMEPDSGETTLERPSPAAAIAPKQQREAMLAKLLENPDQVQDPLSVADVLYQKGDIQKAGIFYELAYNALADQKEDPNRSWILFQYANCLRFDDPPQAADLYDQLINDYPVCEWIEMARSRRKIVEWFLDDKNVALLEKYTINDF